MAKLERIPERPRLKLFLGRQGLAFRYNADTFYIVLCMCVCRAVARNLIWGVQYEGGGGEMAEGHYGGGELLEFLL